MFEMGFLIDFLNLLMLENEKNKQNAELAFIIFTKQSNKV